MIKPGVKPGLTLLPSGDIRVITPVGPQQTIMTTIPAAATRKVAVWRQDTAQPVTLDIEKQIEFRKADNGPKRPLVVGKYMLL